jgi:hypothetical protein
MSINRQEFTDAGRDMLGRANNGETLTIAHVVVGETRVAAPADLWPLDVIPGYVMDVVITQQTDQGGGILLIDAAFNSSQAPRAFELCGVGVMAHIANEPDRLYSVANVLATGADNVDPAVESIHAFKIKVVIDRAANVTVVIGTSQDILGENIGAATVGAGVFSDKLANTLRFKRLVMGTNIEIVEDADTITISQRTLMVDVDLYVPTTHPDAPSLDVAFPTIQDALDSLSNINIPVERTATIHVQGINYSITNTIVVEHPQSDRIQIIGETLDYQILSMISGSNTPNDHIIVLQLDSAAGIVVGDLVNIYQAGGGGNNSSILKGVFEVTAVDLVANTITIQVIFRLNLGVIPGFIGRLYVLKTRITVPAGENGIDINGKGLLALTNFGFTSAGAASNGIMCRRNTTVALNNVGVMFFINSGIDAGYSSSIQGESISVARCGTGFFAGTGSNTTIINGALSYCTTGVFVSQAQILFSEVWSVNCIIGWNCGPDGLISCTGNNVIFWSVSMGISVTWKSLVILTGAGGVLNVSVGNVQDINLNVLSAVDKAAGLQLLWLTSNLIAPPSGFSAETGGCYLVPSGLVDAEPEHPMERED